MRLRLSEAAKSELNDIIYYGAKQWGRDAGLNYGAELRLYCETLLRQPEMGALVPGVSGPLRWILHKSHIIVYQINGAEIEIMALRHARSDWAAEFLRQFG